MSEAQAAPEVTGKMFLYERPELLMKEKHGDLALKAPSHPFAFAAKARAIPLTLSEIPSAMKDYPVIVLSREQPQLLAVTGLYDDLNLFVDDKGVWEANRYIPGYVRRYPFGLAAETNGERMAIVIDRAYEGLTTAGDVPLFKSGEPTEQTQAAVDFCKNYERDRQMTEQFVKTLIDSDIIQQQTAQYTPTNSKEPVAFAQYFGVAEERLNGLDKDKLADFHARGVLPLAYGMLMSMSNWRMLLQRRAKRFNLTEETMFKPAVN